MDDKQYDTSILFGWSVSLKLYKHAGNFLFNTEAVVNYLRLENQMKKHGFKFIALIGVENTKSADSL